MKRPREEQHELTISGMAEPEPERSQLRECSGMSPERYAKREPLRSDRDRRTRA